MTILSLQKHSKHLHILLFSYFIFGDPFELHLQGVPKKGKGVFGLWVVTLISWATTTPHN